MSSSVNTGDHKGRPYADVSRWDADGMAYHGARIIPGQRPRDTPLKESSREPVSRRPPHAPAAAVGQPVPPRSCRRAGSSSIPRTPPTHSAAAWATRSRRIESAQCDALERDHYLTLVCRDLSELAAYARVDNQSYRVIKRYLPGPFTFVLSATREVPRRLVHRRRRTIGLRVPDNPSPRPSSRARRADDVDHPEAAG